MLAALDRQIKATTASKQKKGELPPHIREGAFTLEIMRSVKLLTLSISAYVRHADHPAHHHCSSSASKPALFHRSIPSNPLPTARGNSSMLRSRLLTQKYFPTQHNVCASLSDALTDGAYKGISFSLSFGKIGGKKGQPGRQVGTGGELGWGLN